VVGMLGWWGYKERDQKEQKIHRGKLSLTARGQATEEEQPLHYREENGDGTERVKSFDRRHHHQRRPLRSEPLQEGDESEEKKS